MFFCFYNFFFTAFNLYDSANLYFLGAARSQTRGHFSLDRKVTKRSIFAIRLRIRKTATTNSYRVAQSSCPSQSPILCSAVLTSTCNLHCTTCKHSILSAPSWASRFLRLLKCSLGSARCFIPGLRRAKICALLRSSAVPPSKKIIFILECVLRFDF